MAEISFFDRVSTHTTHVPDVLSCIANLSNDEVFTPPDVVNKMLDLLPQELFADPKTTFLDPATKTGVFLREIAKRCLDAQLPGYKERSLELTEKKRLGIPLDEYDVAFEKQLQEKIDHIFHNQLFGIGITELTSLLARRSVYCSKWADGPYSITHFDNSDGNILFHRTEHKWGKDGKCVFCGASETQWKRGDALETHAYEFIHTVKPEEIFNMHFDVIIGNPPYQLKTTEIEGKANATPIYNEFIEQAKKLCPKYLTMIIPARWYAGGAGLDSFRDMMLHDDSIREIHDFVNEKDCFAGVEIKGGVCYFLRDASYHGNCVVSQHIGNEIVSTTKRPLLETGLSTFIRHNDSISILNKVREVDDLTTSFSSLVSPQTPFGIISSFKDYHDKQESGDVKFYTAKKEGYINPRHIKSRKELVEGYKVYISKAYGAGEGYPHQIINKPFVGEKNSCCSQTYLLIGTFDKEDVAKNVVTYMRTKFFRFMVMLKKNSQDAMRGVYELVPLQDFSKSWTDEELYAKYKLNQEEINLIESMIKPMDLGGDE